MDQNRTVIATLNPDTAGDEDLTANGEISDPSGPAASGVAVIYSGATEAVTSRISGRE